MMCGVVEIFCSIEGWNILWQFWRLNSVEFAIITFYAVTIPTAYKHHYTVSPLYMFTIFFYNICANFSEMVFFH